MNGAEACLQEGKRKMRDLEALYKDTLVEIAESVGLDSREARNVLDARSFSKLVSQDWDRAWSDGVTGVPTFTSRDLFVFGCQPYEVLLRFYNHLLKLQGEQAITTDTPNGSR